MKGATFPKLIKGIFQEKEFVLCDLWLLLSEPLAFTLHEAHGPLLLVLVKLTPNPNQLVIG